MESGYAGKVRTFFHVDMDAFFVSVEELYDPSLKGKPVVVGGRPDERGVVSAASYAARKFGVHSAMPLRTAYKTVPAGDLRGRAPGALSRVFAQGLRGAAGVLAAGGDGVDRRGVPRYHGHGAAVRAAAARGAPAARAHEGGDQLNCSIGIAASRLVAKISSDQAKPNGVLWIIPGQEAAFLAPLDVRKVPGVGKVTEKNLHALGIRKVGDLARLDEAFLEERFGKWGLALAGKSRGLDAGGWFDTEIGEDEGPKSISHEHTFNEDTADLERIESTLARLSRDGGAAAARAQAAGAHDPAEAALFGFLHHHAGAFGAARHASSTPKSSKRSANCSGGTGRRARRCGCSAYMPRAGRKAASRWTCWARSATKSGSRRWRRRTVCGTSSVSRRFRWRRRLRGKFKERTHENPASLPGKKPGGQGKA